MSGDHNAEERQRELFARLDAERFLEDELSRGETANVRGRSTAREMWNAGSRAAERIVREWLSEERVHAGLDELCDSQPIDLRVKHLLIVEDVLTTERSQYGMDERFDFGGAA